MYLLPDENFVYSEKGCCEKLNSYQKLSKLGLPVLKSAVIPYQEWNQISEEMEDKIRKHLKSSYCMIRYIYTSSCHNIKNGGKIVPVSADSLLAEAEPQTDLWLLEPSDRRNNLYCCNISMNRILENLHIEFVGEGFDISDLNKGKISPHEQMDISYPIEYGLYLEWWKRAKFSFCLQEEYKQSIILRKERWKEFQTLCDITFPETFHPVDFRFLEKIIGYVDRVEESWGQEKPDFYNISCSCEKSGRIICWDIQTPSGKKRAYFQ